MVTADSVRMILVIGLENFSTYRASMINKRSQDFFDQM